MWQRVVWNTVCFFALLAFPAASVALAGVSVCIGGYATPVIAEVADTRERRALGLMERGALAPSDGMLFLYASEQSTSRGFWMYQVQFPLDIAFISADNKIVSIAQMEPCLSSDPKSCPAYYSEKPFQSALEVNAGFLAAEGIEVGDKVRYAVDGKCEHQ